MSTTISISSAELLWTARTFVPMASISSLKCEQLTPRKFRVTAECPLEVPLGQVRCLAIARDVADSFERQRIYLAFDVLPTLGNRLNIVFEVVN
jgi:hypothetical protein